MNVLYVEKTQQKGSGGEHITNRNIASLKRAGKVENFFEYKLIPYKRSILCHFFYSIFLLYGGMRLSDNRKLKRTIIEKNIDLVFVDSSVIGRLSDWIFKNTKVVYYFHNAEYLYAIQDLKHRNLINRLLFRIRALCFYLNEKRICKKTFRIITINKRDSDCLNKLYKRSADFIWSTTFDDKFIQHDYPPTKDRYMLFVGGQFLWKC